MDENRVRQIVLEELELLLFGSEDNKLGYTVKKPEPTGDKIMDQVSEISYRQSVKFQKAISEIDHRSRQAIRDRRLKVQLAADDGTSLDF